MPFPMEIQPIDFTSPEEESESTRYGPAKPPPVFMSRFKRLFERQFTSGLKVVAPPEKQAVGGDGEEEDVYDEFEPSSVCLNNMVENFIYESSDNNKQQRCCRNRCNCLKGNCMDSSDEEAADSFNCALDAYESLKSLAVCACVAERNLLAETAKIVEKNKMGKCKDNFCRKVVTNELLALGYDASICKSRWEKSFSIPAGEYEYVGVEHEVDRIIIDIDFRSEFEIARSTKAYKSILQMLPNIFVGKADRLQRIVSIVSEAARQSLKKKGMSFPPWRKAEYVKAKWLSPYTRTTPPPLASRGSKVEEGDQKEESLEAKKGSCGELELVFGIPAIDDKDGGAHQWESLAVVGKQWKAPETRLKGGSRAAGAKTSLV